MNDLTLSNEKNNILYLSERILASQKNINIMKALKWDQGIKAKFFKDKCKSLPQIDVEYYKNIPLDFQPAEKINEFRKLEHDIIHRLGESNRVGSIMLRICRKYCMAIDMVEARGTSRLNEISKNLYGSTEEPFYRNGPCLMDLANTLSETLSVLSQDIQNKLDVKKYTSLEAAKILNERLNHYFYQKGDKIEVSVDDKITADAAAGGRKIKLCKNVYFSERDIRLLEVHEGWVHVGTSINGSCQPICTFLGQNGAASTLAQEGLAVLTEIFTFSSYPQRMQRLTNRIKSISMAEQGADFLEVFNYFVNDKNILKEEAYDLATRTFRGSLPAGKPFTKDVVYTKGFLAIYNYIRLAVKKGMVQHIPTLFVGKYCLEDLPILNELINEGLVVPPRYVPHQFSDLAALSSWMCFSHFLNRMDLEKFSAQEE